tara:strand:- start:294 stop:791 length:498 start_codon:yes stop_codon:yes gene_type:complete
MPKMEGLTINGFDISPLFDLSLLGTPFADPDIKQIPEFGSIIYTVWHDQNGFIYVGIGGIRGLTVKDRDPRSRIKQHAEGRRSGDQFCVYIQDFFVIPEIVKSGHYQPERGYLDKLTRNYIRAHLSYRFLCFQTEDSDKIVRVLESKIQKGVEGIGPPFLNGKTS